MYELYSMRTRDDIFFIIFTQGMESNKMQQFASLGFFQILTSTSTCTGNTYTDLLAMGCTLINTSEDHETAEDEVETEVHGISAFFSQHDFNSWYM